MLFYKQLNPESEQKLLLSISQYTEDILLHDSSKLSYQLAYDQVYQLCRNQRQQQLLQAVYSSIRRVLPKAFSQLNPQSDQYLLQVSNLIKKTQKNLQTIKDVCLYLDLNYCQRDMNTSLIIKLNQIFLEQFFNRTQLLEALGKIIAKQHLNNNQSSIKQVLQSIKTIDQEEEYFANANNFVRFFLPILIQSYNKEAKQNFHQNDQEKEIQSYIQYAYDSLDKQSQFLNKFWPTNKKCLLNKEFIIKELYQILVTNFKASIYSNHKQKLFNQLTLQVLQLFKFGVKTNDIFEHADWYNVQIKEKLQTFSHENNTDFINRICDFQQKIMGLLEKTYNKFDIHYRSRFAFEEWINAEKLQMPLRLNEYIKEFCLQGDKPQWDQQRTFERINVIFNLMKQKNVFQKYYRRQMTNRILNDFENYPISRQVKIIQLMEKECSQQFVKNIQPIVESYQNSLKEEQKASKLNIFVINIENWPYEQKNMSVLINQSLTSLTQKFTNNFNETSKDKTLYWHPIIGLVKLQIKFIQSKWEGQLIVNTCMANLLLHFVKTKFKSYQLKNFCCETGYKLDELYDSVRKLIQTKIILNQGNQQNYKLAINQNFSCTNSFYNALNIEAVKIFQEKPLEQLKADRKFMVQAIIVKLMKKLKHTDKQTILKQAGPLIQKRGFNFNAKFVQSAIERLVDKEFIRDFEDGKLGYIA